MHLLKTPLLTLLSLSLTATSTSVPVPQNVQFFQSRISNYRQNPNNKNNLNEAQNNALDSALETIRNQDLDSYDEMKETLISAFGFDEAKALFAPGPAATQGNGDDKNKLETRVRECECSTFDGSDCDDRGWVCVERDNDPNLHCEDSGPIGGCGWGGLHGCIGVCVPP